MGLHDSEDELIGGKSNLGHKLKVWSKSLVL